MSEEVFEAEIRRIEDTTASTIQSLRDRIDTQDIRISDLKDSIIRGWTVLGVVAAIAAIVFTGVQWYVASKGGERNDVPRETISQQQNAPITYPSGAPVSAEQTPSGISVELP